MQKRRRKEKEKENSVLPELAKMAPGALLPGGQSCAFVPTRLSAGNCLVPSPSQHKDPLPMWHMGWGYGPQASLSLPLPKFSLCEPLPVRIAQHM